MLPYHKIVRLDSLDSYISFVHGLPHCLETNRYAGDGPDPTDDDTVVSSYSAYSLSATTRAVCDHGAEVQLQRPPDSISC